MPRSVKDLVKHVLVTGGAGFIGSKIARRFVADGFRVTVLDDLSGGRADSVPDKAKLVLWDISDPATSDTIVQIRPDLVVHAAARVSVPQSIAAPERDLEVNVIGTMRVLQGAKAVANRVVFLSSGGAIYGESDGVDEAALPRPSSPYGAHKWLAEHYVTHSGISYAVARLANVYGPGQRSGIEGGAIASFGESIRTGRPITVHGDGEQRRDFVYVDDVVDVVNLMANADLDGIWNIGTGTASSINEVVTLMMDVCGSEVPILHRSARPGDVRVSRLDPTRARDDLGWIASTSLRVGLSAVLEDRAKAAEAAPPH